MPVNEIVAKICTHCLSNSQSISTLETPIVHFRIFLKPCHPFLQKFAPLLDRG